MDEASPVDPTQVRSAALAGAADQEIADYFEISLAAVQEQFGEVVKQARAARAISLRRKETSVALEGNVSMLQFLGKIELGQVDVGGQGDERWPEPPVDAAMG